MAKIGSYRWEGREKILRVLRDEARREVEEALEEVAHNLGPVTITEAEVELIVGSVLASGSATEAVMSIYDRRLWD